MKSLGLCATCALGEATPLDEWWEMHEMDCPHPLKEIKS